MALGACRATTRLLLASALWSLVGACLVGAGLGWLAGAGPVRAGVGLVAAVLLGAAKARLLLTDRAAANASRILDAGDGRSPIEIYSPGTWLLVLLMMAVGFGLRRSGLPRPWLGLVYAAVGSALLTASAVSWKRWWKARKHARQGEA